MSSAKHFIWAVLLAVSGAAIWLATHCGTPPNGSTITAAPVRSAAEVPRRTPARSAAPEPTRRAMATAGPQRPRTNSERIRDAALAPFDSDAPIWVRPEQVLATVNDQPIRLGDLHPPGPDETQQSMATGEYQHQLSRAIDMELTFQAARRQGVTLTPQQERRLDQLAQRHQKDLDYYREYGVSWSSVTAEQVEFQRRYVAALMLQQNLAAQGTDPPGNPVGRKDDRQGADAALDRLRASARITVAPW